MTHSPLHFVLHSSFYDYGTVILDSGATLLRNENSNEVPAVFLYAISFVLLYLHMILLLNTCPTALKTEHQKSIEKERCSGSFHLAVGFLVIKDDSISERLG